MSFGTLRSSLSSATPCVRHVPGEQEWEWVICNCVGMGAGVGVGACACACACACLDSNAGVEWCTVACATSLAGGFMWDSVRIRASPGAALESGGVCSAPYAQKTTKERNINREPEVVLYTQDILRNECRTGDHGSRKLRSGEEAKREYVFSSTCTENYKAKKHQQGARGGTHRKFCEMRDVRATMEVGR